MAKTTLFQVDVDEDMADRVDAAMAKWRINRTEFLRAAITDLCDKLERTKSPFPEVERAAG